MTKILFVAYYFPPLGGGPVQRPQKFIQFLPSEGFLPLVVAGPELGGADYPSGVDATLMTAIPSNVPVYRVEGPVPRPETKMRRRLVRWLALRSSFSTWWIQSATEVACRAAKEASLIFATMAPFESAEVASEVSRRLGIPWVADLRDPWALDEMQRYPTLLHRKLEMAKMEKSLSSASLIVMNTPEATVALKRAFPRFRNKKVLTITNGFDREDFANDVERKRDSRFRIVHSGGMWTGSALHLRGRWFCRLLGGVRRGLDLWTRSHVILLQAIERWCSERPEVRKHLEIVFGGKASQEDRAVAEHSKLADLILFTGYLPHLESVQLIRTADLLFLPMQNLPAGKRATIVPGKTYEYMASGRPILAAVPHGDARDFLSQCGTGLICRPDDVSGMIRILDHVYEAWQNRESIVSPNENFVSQFERRTLTRALARAFNSLLAKEETRALVQFS